MKNTALICVTHDPSGNNIDLLKKHAPRFSKLYRDFYICVSDETNHALITQLETIGFQIQIIRKSGVANARRSVVEFGLSGHNDVFHYCDFDRLLTWFENNEANNETELEKMLEISNQYDYLIIGRTEKAFRTHPKEWIETERISNKIFSLELGKEADVTAGSCLFSRKCAALISLHSKDKMTDAEWPMIVHRIGKYSVDYLAVEGLEYQDEINGYASHVDESDKWFGRVRLCYLISESAMKAGKTNN